VVVEIFHLKVLKMVAVRHLDFLNLNFEHLPMHHCANFRQNRPNGSREITIFRHSRRRTSAILDFQNFKFLLSDCVGRTNIHHLTEFRQNQSNVQAVMLYRQLGIATGAWIRGIAGEELMIQTPLHPATIRVTYGIATNPMINFWSGGIPSDPHPLLPVDKN